jgi:hydrogenase expression/formation protein HypC
MCLGIPARVLEVRETFATVEVGGVAREVSVMLVDDVQVGEWVILHAGFAIHKIDPEEAEKTLQLLRELPNAAEIR